MISQGAASPGALDIYEAGMKQLTTLFPDRWGIIATAEDTMRSERWPAILERLMEDQQVVN